MRKSDVYKSISVLALLLSLVGCNSRRITLDYSKLNNNSQTNLNTSVACTVPLNVSLTQISPLPGTTITSTTEVVFLVSISGGCVLPPFYLVQATPNPFPGGLQSVTVAGNSFTFSSRFPVGSSQMQTVTVQAYNSDRSPYQTITQSLSGINVVAPIADRLECASTLTLPASSAQLASNGEFAAPKPQKQFALNFLKNGAQVAGKVIGVQSVRSGLPVTLVNPTSLSSSAADVPTFNLTLGFNRPGLQELDILVASGNLTSTCRATVPLNGIAYVPPVTPPTTPTTPVTPPPPPPPPPAPTGTISIAPNVITLGASTTISFSAQNVQGICQIVNVNGATIYSGPASGTFAATPASLSDNTFRLICDGAQVAAMGVTIYPRPADVVWNYVPGSQGSPAPLPMPMFDGWINNGVTYGNNPGGWDAYGELLCTGSPQCDTWNILRANGMSTAISPILFTRAGFTAACGGTQGTQNGARISWSGDPRLGKVGAYPFVHGGGSLQVVLTTNFRTFSLGSTNQRAQATFTPGVIVDGNKVLFIYRSYQRSTLYKVITLAPQEVAVQVDAVAVLNDNASCGANISYVQK